MCVWVVSAYPFTPTHPNPPALRGGKVEDPSPEDKMHLLYGWIVLIVAKEPPSRLLLQNGGLALRR